VCLANPHEQTTVPSATGDEMPCLKSEHKAKKRALGYLRMNMGRHSTTKKCKH